MAVVGGGMWEMRKGRRETFFCLLINCLASCYLIPQLVPHPLDGSSS